ncbi:hypothetical protein EYF80_042461 [Liparis tanakae]|uniref:Uncharacterized protein n=1 Tax=Liparis tanakae TaxID=230148 RepID=A0A4Z2G387_9TELE|nr:hypothetical protein EYF80_042461 [Liparis tanakae]
MEEEKEMPERDSGNELLYRDRDGDVVKFNVDSDEKTVLVHNKKFSFRCVTCLGSGTKSFCSPAYGARGPSPLAAPPLDRDASRKNEAVNAFRQSIFEGGSTHALRRHSNLHEW